MKLKLRVLAMLSLLLFVQGCTSFSRPIEVRLSAKSIDIGGRIVVEVKNHSKDKILCGAGIERLVRRDWKEFVPDVSQSKIDKKFLLRLVNAGKTISFIWDTISTPTLNHNVDGSSNGVIKGKYRFFVYYLDEMNDRRGKVYSRVFDLK